MGYEIFTGIEIQKRFFVEFQLRSGLGALGAIQSMQTGGAAISAGFLW
jgi:hypothetical protein